MIIGPSHVVRWNRLKNFFAIDEDFYGLGGLPIWHHNIKKTINTDRQFIMVGDFRFGNSYHLTNNEIDAFTVNKDLINHETDRLMFEKSSESLHQLTTNNIRLVFWCLFIREYKNIQSFKYVTKGDYKHPIWNLTSIENTYPNCIKLSGLLKHSLDFLFIDSSNHPSTFGYIFLRALHNGQNANQAMLTALHAKAELFKIYNVFSNNKFIISGTNSTFRLVKDYLSKGILDSSKLHNLHVREADEALFASHKFHKNIIYFAKDEDAKPDSTEYSFFDKAPYENKVLIIKRLEKTYFYSANKLEKPKLVFVLVTNEDDEEIVGNIYNLIGLSQVLYYAMAICSSHETITNNPYLTFRELARRHPAE